MGLSTDLLLQFAKMTKTETKTKSPSYVFGEMVIDNGSQYVRLDGSELLTPVTSTVVANNGERVTVMLKNHTATVTGNLSSPAARSASLEDLSDSALTVAELNTQIARIDDLEAARVNVVGTLNAHGANIENLQSDNVTINNTLSAASADITDLQTTKIDAETVRTTYATILELDAAEARIDTLQTTKIDAETVRTTYATIANLNATNAALANLVATTITADDIRATYATIADLNAAEADIADLQADKIDATTVAATYATIANLNSANAAIENLRSSKIDATTVQSTYATIAALAAATAAISELQTGKLDAESIEGRFANIDFSNITEATMETFFAASGLIGEVTIDNATITGHLQGVSISGDLIDANTLKANRLLLLGSDGLYYKLNTDGVKVEAQQTNQNSLDGTVIKAKSITAGKIDVTDLNAFDATIGNFKIGTTSLYSGTKTTANNTTRGIYLDTDGQIAFGDANNFVKFFKDTDNAYKLNINANTIVFGANDRNLETALDDVSKTATNFMNLTSDGLVVGDQRADTLLGNILLKAEQSGASIALRNGATSLVVFSAASRTFSGVTSAITDSTDQNGRTQTVTSDQTFNTVQFTSANPIYFSAGLKTNGIAINPNSIIVNGDFTLNGTMFDSLGRSVVEGISGSQNLAIGYGRYKNATPTDQTKTILYGNNVDIRADKGFTVMQDLKTVIQSRPNQSMLVGLSVYEEGTNSLMLYGGTSIDLVTKQTATVNGVINVGGALLPSDHAEYSLGNRNYGWSNMFLGQGVGENSQLRCIEADNSNTNICGVTADGYLIFGTNVKENFYRAKNVSNSATGLAFRISSGGESSNAVNNGTTFLYGGADSNGRYIGSHVAYSRTTTSAQNLFVGASGNIARSTSSSERYKRDIVDAPLSELSGLYNLPVKKFKYNNDYIYPDDELYDCCLYGFMAEDVEDVLPCAVEHIDDGEGNMTPEMWNINIIVPAMMKLIQDLNTRVSAIGSGGGTSGSGVGKDVAGELIEYPMGTTTTASIKSEIFNDYAARVYNSNGEAIDGNIATGSYSHAEGRCTSAIGWQAHSEGNGTVASGHYSHAEGSKTTASGYQAAHAEGYHTVASGSYAHTEGINTTASDNAGHAEGGGTIAEGMYAHSEGYYTLASGHFSHAGGYYTIANGYQTAIGKCNKSSAGPTSASDTSGDIFIVGNGTLSTSRANALRTTTVGKTYGRSSFASSGADYAEYFEWLDGNPNGEDRRGRFVTLDGEKMRYATSNDEYILGIISATPSCVGDVQSEEWKDQYLMDIYGEKIVEVVEVEETTDDDGNVVPAHTDHRWVPNPEFDPDKEYVSREDRPEWDAVGLLGKLVVEDDGTCYVNGYCSPSTDGIATSNSNGYKVIARVDNTHVKIMLK